MRRWLTVLLAVSACTGPVLDEPWRIVAPRIIAVTADPPEAPPGAQVVLHAVVATPDGPPATAGFQWAPCEHPRPFSQNESIDASCLAAVGSAPPGGAEHALALSPDVCAVFGPDMSGEGLRPRDADSTGGYYQPVGVQLEGASSFAAVRLWCRPAGVSLDVARGWVDTARPNTNPAFMLSAAFEGRAVPFDALPAGVTVDLLADWSGSPEEHDVVVAPGGGSLETAIERYDVSWFVTDGSLSAARSSIGAGRWLLPQSPGTGTLWAILRDSRGGVAVQTSSVRWE